MNDLPTMWMPEHAVEGVRLLDRLKKQSRADFSSAPFGPGDVPYVPQSALIESQVALAAATEEQSRAWALLTGERWTQTRAEGSLVEAAERVVAALAAANVEASRMREYVKGLLAESGRFAAERDALRADLARVTAERDEAQSKVASLHAQLQMMNPIVSAAVDRAEKAESDIATLRESVRELVDRARDARRVFVILERCNAIPNGGEDHGNMLDIMDVRQKIDALLAKHAAPAPTPADAKPTAKRLSGNKS